VRRLFRRSRAFRIVCCAALVPVWVLVALVSSNTLSGYTATGNVVMVVLFMFFALWAWWYAEDRDRRSAPSEPPRRPDADSG
jgi:hypothetical protein